MAKKRRAGNGGKPKSDKSKQTGSVTSRVVDEAQALLPDLATAVAGFQNATDAVDEAAAATLGLNRTDLRCLGILYLRGQLTAGELAAAAGLSRPAMTTAIDRLEAAGHVRRAIVPGDRRRVAVQVTERALAATEAIWGPIAGEGLARGAQYSSEELALIIGFLQAGERLQVAHAARIRAGLPGLPVAITAAPATDRKRATRGGGS